MTHDKKSKHKKERKNKEETDLESLASKISEDTEPHSPKNISVRNVREELKQVINNMGPNTNNNSETEESSTYSTTDHSYVQAETETSRELISQKLPPIEEETETDYDISELEYSKKYTNTSMQTSQKELLCPNPYNLNIPSHEYWPVLPPELPEIHKKINKNSYHRISRLSSWLGMKKREDISHNLYKINIEADKDEHSPPRRLTFDLLNEPAKAEMRHIGINTSTDNFAKYKPKNERHVKVLKAEETKEKVTERVDIYYFDHGHAEYYQTTDFMPPIKTEYIAERTDFYTKKCWAEFFGVLYIGMAFITGFILQLLRFILQGIVRPLTIGIFQLVSDYFFKPLLAVLFNGVIQPPLIFLYNLMTSIRDVCAPIASSIGYFIREVSVMCKACRLVQIEHKKCCCENDK